MATLPTRKRSCDSGMESTCKRPRREDDVEFRDSGNESDRESEYPSTNQPADPRSTSQSDDRFIQRPNIYHCPFAGCGRSFNRPCRLTEHERSHTGERPFACDQCDKTFPRQEHLNRHKKSAHDGIKDHICTYDGCEKGYATAQKLREHVKGHEKKKEFTCTGYGDCFEAFRKKSTLQAHIASIHLKQKPYPCTHIDEFTGEPCKKGYDTEGKLKGHISKVHGGERYVCSICSNTTHTDSGISMPLDGGSTVPGTPASTTMSLPSHAFPTYHLLQKHISTAHPPTCPHCHSPCTSKRELASHIELHHPDAVQPHLPQMLPPQFPCTVDNCTRIFTKRGNLTVHIDTVHKNHKKFVCGITDLTGSSKFVYDDGAEVSWDREEGGCGRAFGTKAMLENHVRTQHLGLEAWDKVSKRKRGIDTNTKREPRSKGGNQKAQPISATSLLTGQGYEDSGRDIVCLVSDCPHRFYRDFDLRRHCTSAHGMAEVEVNDAMRERAATEGGVFWYRGIDPDEERGFALYEEDDEAFEAQYLGHRASAGSVPIDPLLDSIGIERIQDFVNEVE